MRFKTNRIVIISAMLLGAANLAAWDGRVPVECGWTPSWWGPTGFKCLSNYELDLKRPGYEDCVLERDAGGFKTIRCLKDIGMDCKKDEECKAFSPGTASGAKCCKGLCTKKVTDWIGANVCPDVCLPGAIAGTQCK